MDSKLKKMMDERGIKIEELSEVDESVEEGSLEEEESGEDDEVRDKKLGSSKAHSTTKSQTNALTKPTSKSGLKSNKSDKNNSKLATRKTSKVDLKAKMNVIVEDKDITRGGREKEFSLLDNP